MKTEMCMAPHFQKSLREMDEDIAALNADIGRLQAARRTIVDLYAGGVDPFGGPGRPDESKPPVQTVGQDGQDKQDGGKDKPPRKKTGRRVVAAPVAGGTPALLLDKPDSIAGAMKQIIPSLAQPFKVDQVVVALRADADWKALLEAGSATRPYGNLEYWAEKGRIPGLEGKLAKEGLGVEAKYTFVAA